MTHWLIAEPVGCGSEPVWKIYSEQAIIEEYWTYWERQGRAYNKANGLDQYEGITTSRCIDDWIVIHWATRATPETLLRIIGAPKQQNSES